MYLAGARQNVYLDLGGRMKQEWKRDVLQASIRADEYLTTPEAVKEHKKNMQKTRKERGMSEGGRPPGRRNNDKRELLLRIMDTGCPHPLEGLAILARDAFAEGDKDMAFQCFKELAGYVTPKLKAIDHKVEVENTKQLVIVVPEGMEEDEDDEEVEDGEIIDG